MPQLADLYVDADTVATLYTAFLVLDPLLGLDTAAGARPRCRPGARPRPGARLPRPRPGPFSFSVPSLSRSIPFLDEFTNHLFLGLFVAWVISPFC
jgi:hypothetical protein